MSRCLNLTRTGEYALAALSRLALKDGGRVPVPVESLAGAQRIPKAFLSKIIQHCVRAGLVRAKKGAAGGVSLTRDARDITLLDIFEACEGSYERDACVFYAERRCTGPDCEVYCPLRQEEHRLRERLGRTTLADMARALSVHPDARAAGVLESGGIEWKRD